MSKEPKMAIKAVRLARLAIEIFIDGVELGEGGPIDDPFRAEVIRVKAEVAVVTALLNEVLSRKREAE